MPKKTNNQKRSPLLAISIIALILIGLIIGGTYLYVSALDNGGVYDTILELRINKNIKEQTVKDTLTYTLPSGWTDDAKVTYPKGNTVILGSEDYKAPEGSYPGNGVSLSFDVTPRYIFMTLNELKWMAAKGDSPDYVSTKIDGIQAIKREENNVPSYILIKGDYMITIGVTAYNNGNKDGKYTNDINSVINSIHFN